MAAPVVLVVDDEAEHRLLMTFVLGKEFRVLTAASGDEGLMMAYTNQIDVALVDQRMPGMTGIEMLTRLRERQPACLRVLLTAYVDADIMRTAINDAGVYRFLTKPTDPETLRLDIRRAVEHRRSQDDLIRSSKLAMVGRLAGTIATDLKNCIPDLIAAQQVLAELGDEHVAEQVNRTADTLVALQEELDALRDGRAPRYELRESSLLDVVSRAVRNCDSPQLRTRRVSLDAAPNLPLLDIAPSRCERMVEALLENAIEATRPGGEIGIRLSHDESQISLSIVDDGHGIAEDSMGEIFDPSFSTRRDQRVGMGLTLARTIAQGHGGEIICESRPREGARFVVTLPLPAGLEGGV